MRLTRIPVETDGFGGRTNAYVLGTDSALLVDPAAREPELDTAVGDRSIDHIAVTHHHPDHVGAVRHYADRTGATVWTHATHVADFETATGISPDQTVRGGDTIETAAGAITVRTMPGHAREHLVFEWDEGMLVGDLAVATGSVAVGGSGADMRAYLTSLRRLHASDPDRLYPGHGPVIEEPRGTLQRLIDHRLQRERQVRRAVETGASSLDEILAAVYEKDLTGVREMARATVRCHVEKLAVEGALSWDGDRATIPEH